MAWPYEFRSLSDEEKELRRQSLAFYAAVAHLSAFAPPLASLLFRLVRNASSRLGSRDGGSYEAVPGSPAVKSRRLSGLGGWSSRWARLAWWMGDDVYFRGRHWGQRDEWVVGLSWTAWLLVLCVLGTGSGMSSLTMNLTAIT